MKPASQSGTAALDPAPDAVELDCDAAVDWLLPEVDDTVSVVENPSPLVLLVGLLDPVVNEFFGDGKE